MARLVNLSWIKVSTATTIAPPTSKRGIVKRIALLLLMLAWGMNTYTQTVVNSWTALQTAMAINGSNIQLGQDITAGESDTDIIVPDNVTVTLDLKGHMIDRGLTDRRPAERGSVIKINTEGTLTINDTSTGKTGKITGGIANGGGGILNGGHLTINGGSITGNRSLQNGSGIYNQKGTITISGGNITNNVSSGANGVGSGGGIYNLAGTVTINSGSISNNTSYDGGGGIYNTGYLSERSTLTINGGSITGNRTSYSYGTGGGISNSGSDLIISGGSITNNQSGSYGGGIYNYSGTLTISNNCSITGNSAGRFGGGGVCIRDHTETVSISGNVTINNNTLGSEANNLFLADNNTILTIGGTITSSNKSIGISLENPLRVFTTGGLSNKGGINKLFSDNSLCELTSSGTEARMMGKISPFITVQGWTYGGTAQEPEITGTCISNNICYDGTYSITYQKNQTGNWITSQPVTAGTHNVKVSFPATSDYKAVDAVSSYTVAQANLSVTAPTAASPTYNGNNQNLLATNGSAANGTFYYRLGTSGTWSTTAPKGKNAGSYQVYYYVKGDANHKDSGSESNPLGPVSCTIGKAASSLTADPTRASLTYNGSNQNLLATGGTASGGTIYYRLGSGSWGTAIPQAKDANTYNIRYYVKGDDNHNDIGTTGNPIGTISCSIGKKSITISGITANNREYNGRTNATLNYNNVTYGGKVGSDVLSVSATGTFDNKNVGTNKTVTISGLTLTGSNYQLASSGQQSTAKANITKASLTVTAKNHTITYGDAPANNGVSYSGFVNSETSAVLGGTLAYAYSYSQFDNVGNNYAITPSGLTADNYAITFVPGTLTVAPKGVVVTGITASDKVYDGNTTATINSAATFTGKFDNDELTLTATGVFNDKNVGTGKDVTVSDHALGGTSAGNYTITSTGTQTSTTANITPKTVGITWGPTILTYNNTAQAPTATATELVAGDDCNVTVTGQQTAVGVYSGANVATANALDNGNYQLPDPKPTIAFEIANPLSMSFAAGQLWGTWYGAYNYQVPTGMTAYKVSSVSGTTVTVDAIDYVPANTGVLIKRTATDAANVSSDIYNGVTAGNTSLLVSGNPTAYTDYILFNNQFVLSSVSTIGDHRCYLPGSGVVAGTRGLNIVVGGDDTTDIEQKVIDTIETGEWYDMQGRRIVRPHKKGIYIRDGKKVVIK